MSIFEEYGAYKQNVNRFLCDICRIYGLLVKQLWFNLDSLLESHTAFLITIILSNWVNV